MPKRKKIISFLPKELKDKVVIVDNKGNELDSDGPVFLKVGFPAVDVSKLTDEKINYLMKIKHPSFITPGAFQKISAASK